MFDTFRRAFADPGRVVRDLAEQGHVPIRTLGRDVPRAHLLAAGLQPVRLLAPRLRATPRADAIMGSAEMGPRGRRLLEALLAPDLTAVPLLITQADDDLPQIFAALRELARLGETAPHAMHFLDLLHGERASSRTYKALRLKQMGQWLNTIGGQAITAKGLAEAELVLARQADLLQQLNRLRLRGVLLGSHALQVIEAAAIIPAASYNAGLEHLIAQLETIGEQLPGERVLVCGSPHDGIEVTQAIEQAGGLVLADTHGAALPQRTQSPADSARAIAELAQQANVELVLHFALDGDEAAPWDCAAIRRHLPPAIRFVGLRGDSMVDDRLAMAIARAVTEQDDATRAPPAASPPPPPPPSAPRARPASDQRSRKSLASVADFNRYQRDWFAGVREQVAAGAPFAVVNANAPQEILRAMDIPYVVNQWWASIVAAKQQSRRYQGLLRAQGFPPDVEAYSAQGLAAAFDHDAENAPWGGLPQPHFLHAVASSDPTLKIFAEWSRQVEADCFVYERTVDPRLDLFGDWWDQLPHHWDSALEPARIDLMTAELGAVIARLEERTGRSFSPTRFAEVMALVNEQEHYYRLTRDLIAATHPVPIGIVDSMPATMVPQWHRGTEWARDAARAFYTEVRERAEAGLAAVPDERIRLMWVGRGLWSEMGFYQKWEESHGAVFVWSMYLALAADGYYRDLSGGRDPMRALASRFITMGDELRMPTWAGPWHVHEAQTHGVDAVVALRDADPFVVRALRAAGFPVLELAADNFNRAGEDAAGIEAAITAFIEGPAHLRGQQRSGGRA